MQASPDRTRAQSLDVANNGKLHPCKKKQSGSGAKQAGLANKIPSPYEFRQKRTPKKKRLKKARNAPYKMTDDGQLYSKGSRKIIVESRSEPVDMISMGISSNVSMRFI